MHAGGELKFVRGWKAIADRLKITLDQLKVWHRKTPMPVSKFGEGKNSTVLIAEQDLLEWVREHRKEQESCC